MLYKQNPLLTRTKLTILKMYIASILTYAGTAWCTLITDRQWNKLNAIQNISLNIITDTPWFARNWVLHHSSIKRCCPASLLEINQKHIKPLTSYNPRHGTKFRSSCIQLELFFRPSLPCNVMQYWFNLPKCIVFII